VPAVAGPLPRTPDLGCIHVVASIGRVGLKLCTDLRDARRRRLRIRRPALTLERHISEVVAGSPVLDEMRGPLKARRTQLPGNPPGAGL